MDTNSCDLEFFDFENASEEEIKEVHAILKGPGSNGSVELPWEIPVKENCSESFPKNEGAVEKELSPATKSAKTLGAVVGPALHFAAPPTPLSPVARLPPPTVEAFIAPPTTVGPYPNPPYFVSRTIPYLRAYPHMGVPFFACPIPGAAGETSPLPSPYGQFVPVVPATAAQEKFVGHLENESNQKNRPADRQYCHRSKKKSSSDYSSSFESETVDSYREPMLIDEQASASSPVSSTVTSERPTSVPLVPLPVPPPAFSVASGTLPLHGYPPGLHSLPYTQMSGPQAPSAAMYYVPVFNHPYGSYIPSPPSAPMVLPVNLPQETVTSSPVNTTCNDEVLTTIDTTPLISLAKHSESPPYVQSNCEQVPSEESQYMEPVDKVASVDAAAKNVSESEDITDCNSSSDYPMSKSVSSSPDCIPETRMASDCYSKCLPASEDVKHAGRDPSRCWADLFKKPSLEVNGIDRQLATEQVPGSMNNVKKDIANGKVYVPASEIH